MVSSTRPICATPDGRRDPSRWWAGAGLRDCCVGVHRADPTLYRKYTFGLYRLGLDALANSLEIMSFQDLASPAGLEPATPGLGNRCSIRLSYGDLMIFQ